MKNIKEIEKEITHPLEEVFDIEENTTVVPYKQVKTDLVPYEPYDEKDAEIEEQLQELYDMALEAFENQQDESDTIEAKFRARNAEVAVQYLKTALEAAREKRQLKEHKDKIIVKGKSGPVTNNNLVVSDFDALMDVIDDVKKRSEALPGEVE